MTLTERRPLFVLTAIACAFGGILLGAAILLARPSPPAANPTSGEAGLIAPRRLTPTSRADGPSLGLPSAALTLDLYSDFQCPFCAQFDREILQPLVDEFVTPGYVRFTEHDIAILGRSGSGFDESLESATAATCAELQGKYWPYHDWLFANQDGENRGGFSRPRLDAIAAAVGLDRGSFDSCLSGSEVRALVRAATQRALDGGVAGTPTLYIDGQPAGDLQIYGQLATYLRSRLHLPAASP